MTGTVLMYGKNDLSHEQITGTITFEHPGFVTVRWDGRMESFPNNHVHRIVWSTT